MLTFFIFFLLAFIFWLLQYCQQEFEVSLAIPVEYKNIPIGVVLDTIIPHSMQVQIRDKGTTLISYFLKKKYDPIAIDLENLDLQKTIYTLPEADLEKEIGRLLLSSTVLSGYNPRQFNIAYYPLEQKQVPVLLNGYIHPAIGYMMFDTIQLEPATVTVYGMADVLANVTDVLTETIQWEGIDKSIKKKLRLFTPEHTTINAQWTELLVDIVEYTEKTLEVAVNCHNIPPQFTVRFFPSTVEVICPVALSQYVEMQESSLEICVEFQQLLQNTTDSFFAELSKKPSWLKNYRIMPEQVEFLIEKKSDI